MKIYEAENYRDYLKQRFDEQGHRSGARAGAARALAVHTTYLSQILSGKADLSAEQAELMNDFLRHDEDEAEYFSLLVCRDRARSSKARQRFQALLSAKRTQKLTPTKVVRPSTGISAADTTRFYSSYLYAAIHVLASVPAFQTKAALALALRVHPADLDDKLDFLVSCGILRTGGGRYSAGPNHVHLPATDPLIKNLHTNWRLCAVQSLDSPSSNDMHYSACVSLSREDAERIKLSLLENLKKHQDVIAKSPEETAYVYAFDFFPLVR
jgi:uncharacterized protein (TIGR02147 family)